MDSFFNFFNIRNSRSDGVVWSDGLISLDEPRWSDRFASSGKFYKFEVGHNSKDQNYIQPRITMKAKSLHGISPEEIKDKIFQPFFTTKPSGQGTGLGLSLSYDIVKAHGGELKVEAEDGKGSVFIIEIPIEKSEA